LLVSCATSDVTSGPADASGTSDARANEAATVLHDINAEGGSDDGGPDSEEPDDAGLFDAGPREAGPPGCFTVSGTGPTEECSFSSDPADDAGCADDGDDGSEADGVEAGLGHCPSSGLSGCCVVSPPLEGGALTPACPSITECYYSSKPRPCAAAGGMVSPESCCQFQQYSGCPVGWDTTAP
jgi:hypothetical protein